MTRGREKDLVHKGEAERERLLNAMQHAAEDLIRQELPAGLYVVSTPIGRLGDITLRALSVLLNADLVYCEDTRHSARLFQHYGIGPKTRALHEHNEDAELPRALQALGEGKRIAVISDAGTPLISDPGFRLVRAAAEAGYAIHSVPGPTSVIAALSVSGLATDTFTFAGFLPARAGQRQSRLTALKDVPGTLIFFETPQRIAESLTDMAGILGERPAVVARELTKLHEELARGSLGALAKDFNNRDTKGEIVVVIGPAPDREPEDGEIAEKLAVALKDAKLNDASRSVAELLGVSKSRVYAIGLKLKGSAS